MFRIYRKLSYTKNKLNTQLLKIYLPRQVKKIYLERIKKDEILGRHVVIYGNEKNGVIVVLPTELDSKVQEIGIENIGKLLTEDNV